MYPHAVPSIDLILQMLGKNDAYTTVYACSVNDWYECETI